MKKLIVSIASLGSGGAERVMSVLSKPLADNFSEVEYVLWEGGDPFYDIDPRVKIVSLPELSGKTGRRKQMWTFRHLVRQEHPDLILSFLTPYNMLVLLSTMGLRQKILVAERTDPKRLLSGGRLMLWLRDLLYHRADGILTQTEYAKSCYGGMLNAKTTVIYNPVSMMADYIGRALHTPKERVFVTAGRLEPVKDHELMIEAFGIFRQTHPGYRLIIYGEGPMHGRLNQIVADQGLCGAVVLAGRTDRLWENLVGAEAFLLTSIHEGMSNAMIEAMCLGLPVISTKVAGATDLIEDGVNGFLVDVKDKAALIECMCQLADHLDLRQMLGSEATNVYGLLREDKISAQWIEYLKSKMNITNNEKI